MSTVSPQVNLEIRKGKILMSVPSPVLTDEATSGLAEQTSRGTTCSFLFYLVTMVNLIYNCLANWT